MVEQHMLDHIQQQAQQIADFLQQNDAPHGYDAEALTWLEGYIDRRRDGMAQDERNTLQVLIGAFLGECLRRAYDGEWVGLGEEGKKQLGVEMDLTLTEMPFAKVGRYILDPQFNSFSSLFKTTKGVLRYVRDKRAASNSDQSALTTITPVHMALIDKKYVTAINRDVKIVETLLRDNNITNDYGAMALGGLENLMEGNRYAAVAQNPRWFLEGVGSFLGECLCRTYDGVWVEKEQGIGVQMLDGKLLSFPFSKVTKFIQEGSGDSFVMFFNLIPLMKEKALKGF